MRIEYRKKILLKEDSLSTYGMMTPENFGVLWTETITTPISLFKATFLCQRVCSDPAYLDLPPFVTKYNDHLKQIETAAKEEAVVLMTKASEEAITHFLSTDISVSVDGTWQRRGFLSKKGVVTVLANWGKLKKWSSGPQEHLLPYKHTNEHGQCKTKYNR